MNGWMEMDGLMREQVVDVMLMSPFHPLMLRPKKAKKPKNSKNLADMRSELDTPHHITYHTIP